jgi:hypothetical protein
MCISPCYSDYQTIEAFNITGSPEYETGFFAYTLANTGLPTNNTIYTLTIFYGFLPPYFVEFMR